MPLYSITVEAILHVKVSKTVEVYAVDSSTAIDIVNESTETDKEWDIDLKDVEIIDFEVKDVDYISNQKQDKEYVDENE